MKLTETCFLSYVFDDLYDDRVSGRHTLICIACFMRHALVTLIMRVLTDLKILLQGHTISFKLIYFTLFVSV